MRDRGRELYREFTGWAPWVYILLWGAIGGSAFGAASAGSLWVGALSLGSAALIHVVFGGLLVTVERDKIRVGLGRLRLLKTSIEFSNIRTLESVTYRPLKEFGGWGLRGRGEKRAWTARGNEAVLIRTRDGRRIYVGSDEPSKLEEHIRNAMSVGGFGMD